MRTRTSNLWAVGAAALVCVLGAAAAGAGVFARQAQPQQTPRQTPPQAPPGQTTPAEAVRAISLPRNPLPPEDKSAGVTRFSFIVHGDKRGRRDGVEIQYEHSLVVDSMLAAVKRLEGTPYPVRFVLQSGDAVVDGRDPAQWNRSFVGLINRLTTEGGVPYFLAPGNHDVTGASALASPERQKGLQNYLAAVGHLIPPDGAARRLAGYPTYAFGYGNTFVLALDSNIADDEGQFDWARAQLGGLDRNRYPNVVAFFHHPPFSSGPHGGARVGAQAALVRSRWMPLFRAHNVKAVFAGHEHLFEHWVERYTDAAGKPRRLDMVITGGGGAPIYSHSGEPDVSAYEKANEASKVRLEHLVRPGPARGDNPYHYVVVQVDGERMRMDVFGVDWGAGFRPYRSNRVALEDEAAPQP